MTDKATVSFDGGTVEVEGNSMTIKVDLENKGHPSASGKTNVIATTAGAVNIAGVSVGLNVYRKAKS